MSTYRVNNIVLVDNLVDPIDTSKKLKLSLTSISTGTTRILSVPNATTTIVGTDVVQTLTNKTITGTTNTVSANRLRTTGTDVTISAAAPPNINQVLVATSATTATWQTLNQATNVPLALAGTVDIFGDSIALGTPPGTSWTSAAVTAYGATPNNLASSGDEIIDMTLRVYGTGVTAPASVGHVNGRTTLFAVGINDVYLQPINAYDELRRTMEVLALYCTLPAANKLDVRNAAVTKSPGGAWTNTPSYNMGMYTTTVGASVTATVTGRYVVWGGTIIITSSLSSHVNASVVVDSVTINSSVGRYSGSTINSINGTNFVNSLWLYDTGSAIAHTITITNLTPTGAAGQFLLVDWIGAFNPNQTGASAVYLTTPDSTDWTLMNESFPSAQNGNDNKWNDIRTLFHKVSRKWNTEFGLPIFYVDMSTTVLYGQKQNDLLHPNANGQNYLANRFQAMINTGKYNILTV